MKILTTLFMTLFLTACMQTKEDVTASKCRLKLPIKKEQCEVVGVYNTLGGRMDALPVSGAEK